MIRSLRPTAVLAASLLMLACASAPVTPEQKIHDQADAMRTAVTKSVTEPARRQELLGLVNELEQVLKEQNLDLTQLAHQLQALNADYDAPREHFDAALHEFDQRVAARFERVQTLHFAMVKKTSAGEWKELVEFEHAALGAAGSADVDAIKGGKS
jgi:hypothetical protein